MINLTIASGGNETTLDVTPWFEQASKKDIFSFLDYYYEGKQKGHKIEEQDIAAFFVDTNKEVKNIFGFQFVNRAAFPHFDVCRIDDETQLTDYVMMRFPRDYMLHFLDCRYSKRIIRKAFGEFTTDTYRGNEYLAWCLLEDYGLDSLFRKLGGGICEQHEHLSSFLAAKEIKQKAVNLA